MNIPTRRTRSACCAHAASGHAAAAPPFLVLTAEDERPDGGKQARQNVVHEAGLFQGRLGFKKAIVLLEDGCEKFSNIDGLGDIRFPSGKIETIFEQVRRVLQREGLVP
jgi:predicted nucleotide-binding protein